MSSRSITGKVLAEHGHNDAGAAHFGVRRAVDRGKAYAQHRPLSQLIVQRDQLCLAAGRQAAYRRCRGNP